MTLCPIALAVGCHHCLAFSFCPLKTVLGDHSNEPEVLAKAPPSKEKRKNNPRKR
jgi:hypothetical protein